MNKLRVTIEGPQGSGKSLLKSLIGSMLHGSIPNPPFLQIVRSSGVDIVEIPADTASLAARIEQLETDKAALIAHLDKALDFMSILDMAENRSWMKPARELPNRILQPSKPPEPEAWGETMKWLQQAASQLPPLPVSTPPEPCTCPLCDPDTSDRLSELLKSIESMLGLVEKKPLLSDEMLATFKRYNAKAELEGNNLKLSLQGRPQGPMFQMLLTESIRNDDWKAVARLLHDLEEERAAKAPDSPPTAP